MAPSKQGPDFFDREIMLEEKTEPSVWYVAAIAICVFVAVMVVAGLFTGTETVAIPAQ